MTDRAPRDTRRTVLNAAMHLVAERGLQALTHRGVETRAQVSHGVTTYYFKTRAEMILALFEHICDQQIEWITRMYASLAAVSREDPDGVDREAFMRRAIELLVAERTMTLARYELYLSAARDPALQAFTQALRLRHVAIQAEMFRAAGASDPEFAAHRLLSATEGLLLYQLSVPEDDFERWAAPYLLAITDLLIGLIPRR